MNDMPGLNKMVEATRLTRAGRFTEATALLQRMLRGETAPDKTSITAGEIPRSPAGGKPQIIHPNAPTIEETVRPPSSRFGINSRPADMTFASAATTAQPDMVHRLSALVDRVKHLRSGLGLRGLAESAPVSTPDILPEGGKFIEATYCNSAGSRAYKLYIPSGYRGQAIPLVVMSVKWLQRWRKKRSAAPKPRGGSISPLEEFATEVLAVVAEQPDLTLVETVAELRKRRIRTSRSSLWRFLDRHNITLKKKSLQAAERQRADVARARRRWTREQGMLDPGRP